MAKLAITIVNYNSGDFLIDCLKSIEKFKNNISLEIWIIDNNSTDDSVAKIQKLFPKYHYILNKENLGFGKAHNQALRQIKTEYILILNPDTKLEKDVLATMLEFMDQHPDVGASTCQILYGDGSVDLTAHRGFPTPWAAFKYYILKDDSLYHLSKMDLNTIHEVDALSGSFFLTRKKVLDKVGLFDEDYFMYAEDIDLSFRIKQAGYKVMYVPTVKIIHYKGMSTGIKKNTTAKSSATMGTRKKMTGYFYDTMKIYYKKHYANQYPFFINWLVYLGISLKAWSAQRKLTV